MGQEARCHGAETVTERLRAVQRHDCKEAAERCRQEEPDEGCQGIEEVDRCMDKKCWTY